MDHEASVTDTAPTLAELLDTDFPDDRPGQSISGALRSNPEHPKLVVVWDGGGTNMLETFPDARPNLSRIMEAGTWVTATVGSSPSVTPSIHANIGTGAFPDRHGIVGIDIREGDNTIDSFEEARPSTWRSRRWPMSTTSPPATGRGSACSEQAHGITG